MRVAITADLHLTTREQHPERFLALANIMDQMIAAETRVLIIAGDAFEASERSLADFEAICQSRAQAGIEVMLVPGNHDQGLRKGAIAAENVRLVTEAQFVKLADAAPAFLLIPFTSGMTMGEAIQPFAEELPAGDWVLVGHGDWSGGLRQPNPYEPGVYMPLTRRDIGAYEPREIFLGHIHRPTDHERLHYPGSPCGLDITETGPRRFLIYDAASGQVESHRVDNPVVYYDESFVMLPVEDEEDFVQQMVQERVASWDLEEGDIGKVRVRARVSGFSRDRRALSAAFERAFEGIEFYEGTPPDISSVSIALDPDRNAIAERVLARVKAQEWPDGGDEPGQEEIMRQSLEVIYGE